jgi:hypothetical protein
MSSSELSTPAATHSEESERLEEKLEKVIEELKSGEDRGGQERENEEEEAVFFRQEGRRR